MAPAGRACFVLTVSDGVAAGHREDESGPVLAARLSELGYRVERGHVPDDAARIAEAVRAATTAHVLVVATGGTGLTPRDVTPQALRGVLEYEVPGFGELMRAEGRRSTPFAALSRSVAGVCGRSLVLAVPGSPRGALESLEAVVPILEHALDTLLDDHTHPVDPSASAASTPDAPVDPPAIP
jgi:molybdenum cofactor synthesis domain-containing protein